MLKDPPQHIRFGPAGNSQSFYDQGFKRTEQAPAWLAERGLQAMEYSSGRGVNLKEETALRIGEQARAYGISFSIHAPYFINLANPTPERYARNIGYITESAAAVRALGGNRIVLHVGTCAKMDRGEAYRNIVDGLRKARRDLLQIGYDEIHLCPETMGRDNQIGDLDEILQLCELDASFIPTIDFAHLHARGRGAITEPEDFQRILSRMDEVLGHGRAKYFHAHFCRIEYTQAGEKRHWTFADTQFGPDFVHLAPLLAVGDWAPTIICESSGTMAEDAIAMQNMVRDALMRS